MLYVVSEYAREAPAVLRDYLNYFTVIKGRAPSTAYEYYLDLRLFFRYLLMQRGLVSRSADFEDISIAHIDLNLISSVQLSDVYDFLSYIAEARPTHANSATTSYGVRPAARARKVAALRSFYKYLTVSAGLIAQNPLTGLEIPTRHTSLPVHLSVDQAVNLLDTVQGPYAARDYCMLTLFLNCGLRVSELVGMNLGDVTDDKLCVIGKGRKERVVYLNQACLDAIDTYLPTRITPHESDARAFFTSRNRNRINVQTVKWLVKKHLGNAGLDTSKLSVHKLRHTAATLMYQNGVDIRTLQTVLGHSNLDTTTIYTHVVDEDLSQASQRNPLANVKMSKKLRQSADEVRAEQAENE